VPRVGGISLIPILKVGIRYQSLGENYEDFDNQDVSNLGGRSLR
jgi:hypothetical protein